MTVYLIIEHDQQQIKASSLNALAAALQLSDQVTALVLGYQCQTVAEAVAQIKGIETVLLADDSAYQHPLAEVFADVIVANLNDASHLIVAASSFGKNLLPRIAAKLGVPQLSDVIEIIDQRTVKRPIYAGNAIATVRVNDQVETACLSVRAAAFAADQLQKSSCVATINNINTTVTEQRVAFCQLESHQSDRPELATADIVMAGGRGLKDQAGFNRMLRIADRLGAAVAASRAAVDAGLAPNDWQVGQTGQVVAPKVYFALGISGAIQHLAGMKDSDIIVAINKDPDAPIFQIADYGLVADLAQVLSEWERELGIADLKNT
jgi:electron transfer flavoprotein alpha subunit